MRSQLSLGKSADRPGGAATPLGRTGCTKHPTPLRSYDHSSRSRPTSLSACALSELPHVVCYLLVSLDCKGLHHDSESDCRWRWMYAASPTSLLVRRGPVLTVTVSGLSAAHTLYLAGANVLVLDKQGACLRPLLALCEGKRPRPPLLGIPD